MKLMILTCAVWPNEEIARKKMWIFLKSCDKWGITPHFYGIGVQPWPGYRKMKLDIQYEFLCTIKDYTHVLYTDSTDAFFVGPEGEIVDKYKAMGSPPILSSAFFQLANCSDAEGKYPGCFDSNLRYRYPNVGGYVAEVSAIVDAFDRMLKLPEQTNDDCWDWYTGWQQGWFRPQLDSQCEIFNVSSDYASVVNGRYCNTFTGTNPCILHLSGGYTSWEYGKDDRLIPWAKELGII